MSEAFQTLMANLRHAGRNCETLKIGGGDFDAKEVWKLIDAQRQELAETKNKLEEAQRHLIHYKDLADKCGNEHGDAE